MNGIESIRESRRDGYWVSPGDDYECLEAERHVDYLLAEVDRLHAKLERIERLQREAAAGRKLYAALKRHHENDLLESQFTESVERVLCAYEQRTGKAVGK